MRSRVLFLLACLLACLPAAERSLLLLRPDRPIFREAEAGLRESLPADLRLEVVDIADIQHADDLAALIDRTAPTALITMDNRALSLSREVDRDLPRIALMALNLRSELANDPRYCGITYEVAPFSVLSAFAQRTSVTVDKLLLVYRASVHADLVQRAERQLALLGVEVATIDIEQYSATRAGAKRFIGNRLQPLLAKETIDACFVMPDNHQLNADTIDDWRRIAERSHKPLLTNIQALVEGDGAFCDFAAVPDHAELGAQSAEIVIRLLDDQVSIAEIGIEDVVSVKELQR